MTINVGASGGLKPPTALEHILMTATTNFYNAAAEAAGTETAPVTSATLTEVLNISGSGVLELGYIACSANANTTAHKCEITIDGVIVVNEASGGVIQTSTAFFNVGIFSNIDKITFGQIVFNSSLVIKVAGDGTNGAAYFYKRYLT